MGMCASGYIFQGKVDELLDYIKYGKTYIDDIYFNQGEIL